MGEWVNVTVGFCPSSTCKGEDQREQGVVTSGGKNQKYTSILPALNGQDARERGADKQLHQLSVWLSPESTKQSAIPKDVLELSLFHLKGTMSLFSSDTILLNSGLILTQDLLLIQL